MGLKEFWIEKKFGSRNYLFLKKKILSKNIWVKKDWGWGESEITAKLSPAGAGAWAELGNYNIQIIKRMNMTPIVIIKQYYKD